MPTKQQLKEMGDRIRSLRKNMGMTGDQFAAKISCTTTYLYQLERGERSPSYKLLERIAGELNASPLHILLGAAMDMDDERDPWVELIVGNLPEDASVTLVIGKKEIPVPHELVEHILKMILRYKK